MKNLELIKGKELFNKQEMILDEIIKNIKNKSENQRKNSYSNNSA